MVRTLASAALRCTLTSQRRVARSLTPAHSHERRCASARAARMSDACAPRTTVYINVLKRCLYTPHLVRVSSGSNEAQLRGRAQGPAVRACNLGCGCATECLMYATTATMASAATTWWDGE